MGHFFIIIIISYNALVPQYTKIVMLVFPQEVALYSNHVIVKDSGSTKHTPWHQDQAYYEIEGRQACT